MGVSQGGVPHFDVDGAFFFKTAGEEHKAYTSDIRRAPLFRVPTSKCGQWLCAALLPL